MAREVWPGLPDGLFSGTRAETIQSYNEANVKNGVQFESSSAPVNLAAAGNIDTIFITGDKPVIIKGRTVKFNGILLTTRVYREPSYTGGNPPSAFYNLNDINPVASTVTIIGGATVTGVGTEFGAPTYDIGSSGLGNVQISTYSTTGVERVLRPNTVYLQRITNDDINPQLVTGALTWYEGDPDLPLTGPLP